MPGACAGLTVPLTWELKKALILSLASFFTITIFTSSYCGLYLLRESEGPKVAEKVLLVRRRSGFVPNHLSFCPSSEKALDPNPRSWTQLGLGESMVSQLVSR